MREVYFEAISVSILLTCVARDIYRDAVNPDHVAIVQGDSISSPDVLRVNVGNFDVPIESQYFVQKMRPFQAELTE